MRDYCCTLATERPTKQTPVYVVRGDAFRQARRKAAQTKMAMQIWIREHSWLPWEKLEEIGGKT